MALATEPHDRDTCDSRSLQFSEYASPAKSQEQIHAFGTFTSASQSGLVSLRHPNLDAGALRGHGDTFGQQEVSLQPPMIINSSTHEIPVDDPTDPLRRLEEQLEHVRGMLYAHEQACWKTAATSPLRPHGRPLASIFRKT